MQHEAETVGSPITLACKHEVETAREVSNSGHKSVFRAENTFAPSLMGEACTRGGLERGLSGREDMPGNLPATQTTCPPIIDADALQRRGGL